MFCAQIVMRNCTRGLLAQRFTVPIACTTITVADASSAGNLIPHTVNRESWPPQRMNSRVVAAGGIVIALSIGLDNN